MGILAASPEPGMDLTLTESQRMVRDMARDFAVNEVLPRARELDKASRWPAELVAQMGALGLMGVAIPESSGGAGMDHVSYALAVEEVSAACASCGVIMSVNNSLVCDPLEKFANPDQKRDVLSKLASGAALGCFGLTEPSSGSDASSMQTVATRHGDEWVIEGSKNWITNGPHADFMVVFATTDRAAGQKGISAFIVPKGTPGFNNLIRDCRVKEPFAVDFVRHAESMGALARRVASLASVRCGSG